MSSFKVVENELYKEVNTATHYIEFDSGPFDGLCFTFGKIEFMGEDEEGHGKINFDYHLISIPETIILEENRDEIERHIGAVLQRILEEQVANEKNNEQEVVNEAGDNDIEQSAQG